MPNLETSRCRTSSGAITSTRSASDYRSTPIAHATEEHFSPDELAKLWHLSANFIRNLFRDEKGVLIISRPETCHKRGYLSMRIPRSIAERVHRQLQAA